MLNLERDVFRINFPAQSLIMGRKFDQLYQRIVTEEFQHKSAEKSSFRVDNFQISDYLSKLMRILSLINFF